MLKRLFIGYYRKCDLLTMLGCLFGFIGIYFAINSNITYSIIALLFCLLCDSFDGWLARKYNYNYFQREYGVQIDSLSDIICFGVLPAVITLSINNTILTLIITIFFLLCGVIRLAYFNMLHTTKRQIKNTYIGLPITMSSVIYPIFYIITSLINKTYLNIVMPLVLLILGICYILRIRVPKLDVTAFMKKLAPILYNFVLYPLILYILFNIFIKINSNDELLIILLILLISYVNIIMVSIFKDTDKSKMYFSTLFGTVLLIGSIVFKSMTLLYIFIAIIMYVIINLILIYISRKYNLNIKINNIKIRLILGILSFIILIIISIFIINNYYIFL